jgi:hypothetical protein
MNTQRSMLVKYCTRGSLFCVLIFTVLVIALHMLRPQMNPLYHAVSEYVLGPFGFLMTIAFIMRGLGELLLVIGLAASTTRNSRSWAGLIFLALATVCSFLVAIFPGNPQNTGMLIIHSVSAFIGFGSLVIAALAWALRFRKEARLRSSALISFILGLLMLFSLVSMVVGSSNLLGLTERILEIFIVLWLCFMAWRLATFASSPSLAPS